MARPVYLICSESGSEDKETGLVSHFTVVEKIQFRPIDATNLGPGQAIAVPQSAFSVTAVWMREKDETADDWFDYSLVVLAPDNEPILGAGGQFQFTRPLHRFTFRSHLTFAFNQSGLVVVESKIRKVGTKDWLTQSYPIVVEQVDLPKTPVGGETTAPQKPKPRQPTQEKSRRGKKG